MAHKYSFFVREDKQPEEWRRNKFLFLYRISFKSVNVFIERSEGNPRKRMEVKEIVQGVELGV